MKERIIIALDFKELSEAERILEQLPDAEYFKVGLQSFLKFGPEIMQLLQVHGKNLFLDLKFKDIPNTVAGAISSCLIYSPRFMTIHLTGGAEMIRRAVESAAPSPELTLLGVTILTSLSDNDLIQMGTGTAVEATVLKLVEMGLQNGLRSFVCSPLEIDPIRRRFTSDVQLVTPGIRPSWASKGDQKRVFTPGLAIKKGSDYLVIGRPVTQHQNPAAAFQEIVTEISASFSN